MRTPRIPNSWITPLRWLVAALFIGAGIKHFTNPKFFRNIVPPMFPAKALLVQVSGVCEIAGGLGILVRPLRRFAGWGLIALLIAVFPANIYMALAPEQTLDSRAPGWILRLILWLRLPLQPVIIAWVWLVALGRYARPTPALSGSHQ